MYPLPGLWESLPLMVLCAEASAGCKLESAVQTLLAPVMCQACEM